MICKLVLALCLLTSPVLAQVKQSGNVTPTHFACWTTNGTIQDCGSSANPYPTTGGVIGPFCVLSAAPTSAGYVSFCLSSATSGGGVLSVQSFGTAPTPGISFLINGVVSSIPLVSGATVNGDGACFISTTGTLADCGFVPLTQALPSGDIWVGNSSNVAIARVMSGDAAISNTGAVTVSKLNSVAYPAAPSINTVPVVTSAANGGTTTYEAVPNAALANPSTTVNGQTCTLGSTCTITAGTNFANPIATVGLSAVNGAASTAMRSDAAPALSSSVQSSLTGTNHSVLLGTGAFGVGALAPCTSGYFVGGTGASTDPTCQGYVSTGSSPTTRTWNAKANDIVSIIDFGANSGASGATNTTAIQNAVNSVTAGGVVLVPGSGYSVASVITITKPVTILCTNYSDASGGNINAAQAGGTVFAINSSYVTIQGCYINRAGTPQSTDYGITVGNDSNATATDAICTNGSGTVTSAGNHFAAAAIGMRIKLPSCASGGATLFTSITAASAGSITISPAAGNTPGAGVAALYGNVYLENTIRDTWTVNHKIGVWWVDAAQQHTDHLYSNSVIGAQQENQLNPDYGDNVIANSEFLSTDNTNGFAFNLLSGGGLKISSSKFLFGKYNLSINWNLGNSANPIITGSSLESAATAAINITQAFPLSRVTITGNSISGAVQIDNAASAILTDLVLSGNTIDGTVTIGKVTSAAITGNTIDNGGAGTCLTIQSAAINVRVASNQYTCSTNISNSGSGSIIAVPMTEGGSGLTSTTNHGVLLGGSTTFGQVSVGATGTALLGQTGADPVFGAVTSAILNITTTTCTNQFVTAISAGAVGTCTTATLAGAQYANQGTTATVLHGNAAGNPSFGAVSLTAEVSGALPFGNGGTGNTATFTTGSIPFSDGSKLTQDNNDLFWDNSNKRFCILLGSSGCNFTMSVLGVSQWGGSAAGAGIRYQFGAGVSSGTDIVGINYNNNALNQIGLSATGNDDLSVATSGNVSTRLALTVGTTLTVTAMASNTGAQSGYVCYNSGTGLTTFDGTNTCLVSSARFKKDIEPISPEEAMLAILALRPVTYEYNQDYLPTGIRAGFIAEQVAMLTNTKLRSTLVGFDEDGKPLNVRETFMTSLLVGAIQQLKAANDNLQRDIDKLKKVTGR